MEDIIIRDATLEDARAILNIYRYYVENTAISFEYSVPSLEEFRMRMRHTLEKYPYLVIVSGNEIVGYSYAGPFKERAAYDWACEMTIYLRHDVQGQGFGRKLYSAMERALAKMGILNLYACIAYPETEDDYLTRGSALFHQHVGYVKTGHFHKCGYKFDRWYDMIWMEKILGEHKSPCRDVERYARD